MVNISRMARAAGIGSAVGATIGGIKEARDKDGDVLGGIVGGAFVGSIGGAGISVGKQALKNKLIAKAYDQNISDSVMAGAEKVYAKHGMPDSTNDLKVAKQISKATSGNTPPIQQEISDFELESSIADVDEIMARYEAGYDYKESGLTDYRDRMRQSKGFYQSMGTYQQLYDHPGVPFDTSDEHYISGLKDAIRDRLKR